MSCLPKPFYDRDGITIYNADCRDVLPFVECDCVVTDPPYGIKLRNGDVDGHRSDTWDSIAGDEDQTVGLHVLDWAEKKQLPLIAFASPWKPLPGYAMNIIAWDKGGSVGGGGDITTCLKRTWELVQVYRNKRIEGSRIGSVWRFPLTPQETRSHICRKPVALMSELISKFMADCNVVFDPFMGSGPTLVAARMLGKSVIGCDVEERHCEFAAESLRSGVQSLMFT